MLKRIYKHTKLLLSVAIVQCHGNNKFDDSSKRSKRPGTPEEVVNELKNEKLYKAAQIFEDHKIDGKYCDRETAELLGYLVGEDKIELQKLTAFIDKFPTLNKKEPQNQLKEKVVNDPVHGTIILPPLCVAIIDTPQFQRLRYLKQMGAVYFVYPGGSHTRFEHSIGVCHLAGQLLKRLQVVHAKDDEIVIDDKDVLCVQMAGLCHDLGHGPFSHQFDEKVIPSLRRDTKWSHEQGSLDMLNHMFLDKSNQLVKKFRDFDLTIKDYIFIREQIKPPSEDSNTKEKRWLYKGRPKTKGFLYEVVANKRNGVDVDKWDYLARDFHHLGIQSSFNHVRAIHFARIINDNGEKHICLRDKEAFSMYEMYHMRYVLQRQVCNHPAHGAIDYMLLDALKSANDVVRLAGKDGNQVTIAQSIEDMEAFTHLTDNIIHLILSTTEQNLSPKQIESLKKAKHILNRIHRREIYKMIGRSVPIPGSNIYSDKYVEEYILKFLPEEVKREVKDKIIVQVVNLNYGKKEKNPLSELKFYSKDDPNSAQNLKPSEVSQFVDRKEFSEQIVRVYVKEKIDEKNKKHLEEALENFRKENENSNCKCSFLRTICQYFKDRRTFNK